MFGKFQISNLPRGFSIPREVQKGDLKNPIFTIIDGCMPQMPPIVLLVPRIGSRGATVCIHETNYLFYVSQLQLGYLFVVIFVACPGCLQLPSWCRDWSPEEQPYAYMNISIRFLILIHSQVVFTVIFVACPGCLQMPSWYRDWGWEE